MRAVVGSLLAVALPALAAARALRATVAPLRGPGAAPALLAAALGVPVGLGAASLLAFAWEILAGGPGGGYAALEAGLLAAVLVLVPGRAEAPGPGREWTRAERRLLAAVLVAAAVSAAAFLAQSRRVPDGDWDAWAMWNTRARLLARAAGPAAGLAPTVLHANPDYPPLLPLTVARAWAYAGSETKLAPALVALAFTAAAAAIPAAAVALLRGRVAALLAAGLLLAAPELVSHGRAQYADLPLAAFLSGAVALALLAARGGGSAAAAWCAFTASCGAFTKNEGILLACTLAAATSVAAARRGRLSGRALTLAALGVAAPLLALLAFKVGWAPPSYLTADQSAAGILARALEPARAALVARRLSWSVLGFGRGAMALLVAVVALARGDGPAPRWPLAVPALALSGYALVYLATPLDLDWQLRTSAERLVLQLWPALVLAVGLRLTPAPPRAA